jgi:hypothetical protein
VTSFTEALNLLNLEPDFNLIQLKDAYRQQVKKWHPDLNPDRLEKATEICKRINIAYDLLEAAASSQGKRLDGRAWSEWIEKQLPKWKREFKTQWRIAYQKSQSGSHPGLHFHSCIANFRRGAIEPRPEWFKGCLFKDTPQNRTIYREHLLKIAPNQKLREEYSRKYFALEFGESQWVFYLPASVAMLQAAGGKS